MLLVALLVSKLFAAPYEIVVTADRIKSEQDQRSLKSSVIATPKQLEYAHGIKFERSGGYGTAAFLSLRGLDPKYTLVLLDGVRMNDPSNPTRAFDFSTLDESNIERVELYQGGSALLYGADAVGGVVNIITKKGKKESEFNASVGGGNNHHKKASVHASGKSGPLSYSNSLSVEKYLGDSISSEKYNPGAEEDGFRKINFSTNLVFDPIMGFDEQAISLRAINSKSSIDAFGGTGGDDSDRIGRGSELYSRWRGVKFFKEGFLELSPELHYSQNRRKIIDGANHDHYFGATKRVAALGTLYFSEQVKTVTGIDVEEEVDKSVASDMERENLVSKALFIDQHLKISPYHFSGGARLTYHPVFHTQENFRLKAGRSFDLLKGRLDFSFADSYKSPTLFQLYSRRYGSKTLMPERSRGFDGEYLVTPFEGVDLGVSYFSTTIKNKISYDFTTERSENIGQSKVNGVDLKSRLALKEWRFNLSQRVLAYENAVRKSHHTTNGSVDYQGLSVRYLYEGKRYDSGGILLESYDKWGMNYRHLLSKNVEFQFEIENIFDQYFEESYGLNGGGREIFGEFIWKS